MIRGIRFNSIWLNQVDRFDQHGAIFGSRAQFLFSPHLQKILFQSFWMTFKISGFFSLLFCLSSLLQGFPLRHYFQDSPPLCSKEISFLLLLLLSFKRICRILFLLLRFSTPIWRIEKERCRRCWDCRQPRRVDSTFQEVSIKRFFRSFMLSFFCFVSLFLCRRLIIPWRAERTAQWTINAPILTGFFN